MTPLTDDPDGSAQGVAALRRHVIIAAPAVLAVPVAFGVAFSLWGISLSWYAVAIGVLGWVIALALRNPIALLAYWRLRTRERVQPWVVAASGPCEESVRVAAVLLVGRAFPIALSIGLGWTAIECVYVIVNGLVIAALARRTDEKARQVIQLIESQGLSNMLKPSSPYWGILERISASGVQIGFTLLLAWQPWLALATIPAHTGINFLWLRLARRSAATTELFMALAGTVALAFGLMVFGRL